MPSFALLNQNTTDASPQTQVAIRDVSQIVDPRGQVAMGLHPL